MSYIDKVEAVLKKYLEREETIDTVKRMYAAVRLADETLAGRAPDAIAVAQMLVDLVIGIPNSSVMRVSNGAVGTAFTIAVNAHYDGISYVQQMAETPESDAEKKRALAVKSVACHYVMHEVALQALLWEKGPGDYRQKAQAFRDELTAIQE
jgi:hypothetical protein